jgi:hypothetical protein
MGHGTTHVNTLAYLRFNVAMPAFFAREVAAVEAHARALDKLAREHGWRCLCSWPRWPWL